MATGSFIAYYRVSTRRQQKSGLGLEAQKTAVLGFLNGGNWTLRGEFTEVESGGNNGRPELLKAIMACRVYGATLIVSKLDRLSRDIRFMVNLQAEGVRFVVADMPEANELTVNIFAAVAQHERKMIGARVRAALAEVKKRGVKKMGGHVERISRSAARKGTARSAQVRTAGAAKRAEAFLPMITALRADGCSSLRELADALNDRGTAAPRGGRWTAMQVKRMLARIEQAPTAG